MPTCPSSRCRCSAPDIDGVTLDRCNLALRPQPAWGDRLRPHDRLVVRAAGRRPLHRSGLGGLREALRCFLWSLRTDPPAGKRRMSWGSLVSIFGQMRVLVCWMAGEGYSRFADLDADAASRFLAALQERPGRGGQVLTIGTRAGYLVTLGRLYAQRQAPRSGL